MTSSANTTVLHIDASARHEGSASRGYSRQRSKPGSTKSAGSGSLFNMAKTAPKAC